LVLSCYLNSKNLNRPENKGDSHTMKRPRDPNQLAKVIVDIATGEVEDTVSASKRHPDAVRGRAGGLKGGVVRFKTLPPAKRSEIASKAARERWKKPESL
jgi:hypothetical protein